MGVFKAPNMCLLENPRKISMPVKPDFMKFARGTLREIHRGYPRYLHKAEYYKSL